MSQTLAGGVSTHPSKSFPAENFFVIPPAGVYRSGEKRPPCDGGLPLGKNSRRSPGTSRRFLYTSHAGAPPAVVASSIQHSAHHYTLPQYKGGKNFTREVGRTGFHPAFRFTVQFASVLRFPSANGRLQFRHRSPAPPWRNIFAAAESWADG